MWNFTHIYILNNIDDKLQKNIEFNLLRKYIIKWYYSERKIRHILRKVVVHNPSTTIFMIFFIRIELVGFYWFSFLPTTEINLSLTCYTGNCRIFLCQSFELRMSTTYIEASSSVVKAKPIWQRILITRDCAGLTWNGQRKIFILK